MAGFLLTGGTDGCPPTQTPPADYDNPFRFDSAGKLWLKGCFKTFQHFGACRHDVPYSVIGSASAPPSASGVVGPYVSAGTATKLTITNTTECDMGILFGPNMIIDSTIRGDRLVQWLLSIMYNGVPTTLIGFANPQILGSSASVRFVGNGSANPHDPNVEGGGAPLTLPAGASADVTCRIYFTYEGGSPTGSETLNSGSSAVRVYGYTL